MNEMRLRVNLNGMTVGLRHWESTFVTKKVCCCPLEISLISFISSQKSFLAAAFSTQVEGYGDIYALEGICRI